MRKRILVVDDDAGARKMAVLFLQQDYEVVDAVCGEDALQILERQAFDLLITDAEMPGMNGRILIERVSERCPGLPCVMLSGSLNDITRRWLESRDIRYLEKPYRRLALLEMVAASLEMA